MMKVPDFGIPEFRLWTHGLIFLFLVRPFVSGNAQLVAWLGFVKSGFDASKWDPPLGKLILLFGNPKGGWCKGA